MQFYPSIVHLFYKQKGVKHWNSAIKRNDVLLPVANKSLLRLIVYCSMQIYYHGTKSLFQSYLWITTKTKTPHQRLVNHSLDPSI